MAVRAYLSAHNAARAAAAAAAAVGRRGSGGRWEGWGGRARKGEGGVLPVTPGNKCPYPIREIHDNIECKFVLLNPDAGAILRMDIN